MHSELKIIPSIKKKVMYVTLKLCENKNVCGLWLLKVKKKWFAFLLVDIFIVKVLSHCSPRAHSAMLSKHHLIML